MLIEFHITADKLKATLLSRMQSTLIRRATLPLYSRCERLLGGRLHGVPSIVAVLLGPDLSPMGRLAARGMYLAMAGKRLAVGDAHGVELFDLPASGRARRDRGRTARQSSRDASGFDAAARVAHAGGRMDRDALSGADVSLRGARDPRSDAAAPWRARAARVGRVIARIDPGGTTIGLYDLARSYEC